MILLSPRNFFTVLLVLMHSVSIYSQDKIYLNGLVKKGKITDITASAIQLTEPQNKNKISEIPTGKALLLVNQKGDYLVPSKLNFDQEQSKWLIKQYLHPETSPVAAKDYVYISGQPRVEGDVMGVEKKVVVVGTGTAVRKIDRSIIVAIIYKDGRHEIFGPVKTAADIMWTSQSALLPPPAETIAKAVSQKSEPMQPPAAPSVIPGASPVNTTPSPASEPVPKPAAATDTQPLTFNDVAGNLAREEFEKKAIQKTKQLNAYLKIICDKSASTEEVSKAVEMAITLFVNDNAEVEISSINSNETVHKKIRQYLSHIKFVQYDKIEIEWTNVQYVSAFRKGTDGNYYGTVSFEQVFRGYRDGKIAYQDITRKNVEVILKTYEKNVQGAVVDDWEVLLGDIGVISTKSI